MKEIQTNAESKKIEVLKIANEAGETVFTYDHKRPAARQKPPKSADNEANEAMMTEAANGKIDAVKVSVIKDLCNKAGKPYEDILRLCGIGNFEEMTNGQFKAMYDRLKG